MFRKAKFIFILFLLSSSGLSFAGEMVRIPEAGPAYLALPKSPDGTPLSNTPAIILIHEWWGLNDQIHGLANQFAEAGFVALAVDLYRGDMASDPTQAHELMRGLPDDRALLDLKAAMTYLSNHNAVGKDKMGVIGWCMGGGYALKWAVEDPRIKALVIYYGKLITDPKTLEKLNAPVLGIFGDQDRGIPVDMVKEFERQLNQLKIRNEIHIYTHAGHAFANPNNQEGYRPEAAAHAWKKTLIFFKSNLA